MSMPGNLVFESPYHPPHSNVFSDVIAAAPDFQLEPMDADLQIAGLDLLDTTALMDLDYGLVGGQDTENYSQPVRGNFPTSGLPLQFDSDALFCESSTLAPSIPCQETMSSHPMSIGPQGWTSQPLPQMEWFLPDANDVECHSGTVEPTPDQILDSILASQMD